MIDTDFKNITVIGAGTMGLGITEVFLLSDAKKIFLNDISEKILNFGQVKIKQNINKSLKKNIKSFIV